MGFVADWHPAPPPEWDSFRMRNLDGGYLDGPGPVYSLASPTFQAFLKTQAQLAVDSGGDGLQLDNIQDQMGFMVYQSPNQGGSFDSVTMGRFGLTCKRSTVSPLCRPSSVSQKLSLSILGIMFEVMVFPTRGIPTRWLDYPLSFLIQSATKSGCFGRPCCVHQAICPAAI